MQKGAQLCLQCTYECTWLFHSITCGQGSTCIVEDDVRHTELVFHFMKECSDAFVTCYISMDDLPNMEAFSTLKQSSCVLK
mmetsp:Transcript_39092/g.100131  ORF Transcript_39092/g.100131 Transcript_39092/m.100131 type:complete len:81 (-) Transcript_39092:137-379(-)